MTAEIIESDGQRYSVLGLIFAQRLHTWIIHGSFAAALEVRLKSEESATALPEQPDMFVAFLFDADHTSFAQSRVYNYGTPCEAAFLRALAASDAGHDCRARVRRGDVLAHDLASKLKCLVMVPDAARKRQSDPSESRHYVTDRHALVTVIGDIAVSLKSLWSSVDLTELPRRLVATNVYCLSAFPMKLPLVKCIDARLKDYPPYIGSVELDAGNPVHVRLFSYLLECVYFAAGKMYVSRWDTDEGVYEFGSEPTNYFEVIELPYEEFQRTAPPFPTASTLSDRGAISAKRFSEVTKPNHFEKVAHELTDLARGRRGQLAVDLRIVVPDDEQLDVPVKKLLEYSLNLDHTTGRHKARLFSDLLGIDGSSWRYLAYQLVDSLANAQLERTRVTDHGVQYSAFVQVVGLNQKTYTVETGWIIRDVGPAQLVTAFPAEKAKQRDDPAAPPPWIPEGTSGAERWQAIYTVACQSAEQAAAACIPTPMQVVGYEIELEGLCGGASIRLDGRSAFARWLVSQGHGSKEFGSGVQVPALVSSQSADRAKAYAKAFARVLWLNGIDGAAVECYLS